MKIKTLFLITILSIIFIWLTNWEEVNLSNEISWKYGVFFCNNKENPTTELQITTMPWNENEICLYFVNESNYDIELEVWIVDWEEIEWWQTRTLGCNLLTQHSKIFDYTEQDRKNPIKIPANTENHQKCIYYFSYMNRMRSPNLFSLWYSMRHQTCMRYVFF